MRLTMVAAPQGSQERAPRSFIQRFLAAPIHFYRRFLSPMKPVPTCRFQPTCSEYALEAISKKGALKGVFLTLWRLLRCNPFGGRGYDPVVSPDVAPAVVLKKAERE